MLLVTHPHKKLLSSDLLGEGDVDLVQELKKFAELLSLCLFASLFLEHLSINIGESKRLSSSSCFGCQFNLDLMPP